MDTPPFTTNDSQPEAPGPVPPIARPPRSSAPWVLLILLGGALLMVIVVVVLGRAFGGARGGLSFSRNKLAVIDISGMIVSGAQGGGLLGTRVAGSRTLVRYLHSAKKDDGIRGVLLRINSPGGSAAASQEIYEAVWEVRRAGKPVFVSMEDVAASGGYYIASAATRIYALPATLTGSIGVIMHMANLTELYRKIGYEPVTIKAGKHKDIGSPGRPLTPEERKMLQTMMDDVHAQFIADIARGRGWPEARVRALADGSLFTGRQAKKLGLVDQLGTCAQATRDLARAAGIKGKPSLVTYERRSFLGQLLEKSAASFGTAVADAALRKMQPGLAQQLLFQPGL